MGEDEKTVNVVEKHYHHGEKETKQSGDGKSVAALATAIGTAAAVIVPAIKKAWTGDGSGSSCGGGLPAAAMAAVASIPAMLCNRGGGNGYHGGGWERGENDRLRAEIAELKAEKFSAAAVKAESDRLIEAYIRPYGQEIADSRVREARMSEQIECLKKTQELEIKIVQKDIELARRDAACCCEKNAAAIAAVEARLNSVTKTVIPNEASCPGWGNVTITPETLATALAAALRARGTAGQQ